MRTYKVAKTKSLEMNRSKRFCCVVGCHSSERKNPKLHFYSFPGRPWEAERKQKWITSVRRLDSSGNGKPWVPNKNARICSAHFVEGAKSNDPRHPAYNPTIFPSIYRKKPPSDASRFNRIKKRNLKKEASSNIYEGNSRTDLLPNPNTKSSEEVAIQTDYCEEDDALNNVTYCWKSENVASTQTLITVCDNKNVVTEALAEVKPETKNASCGPEMEMRGFLGFPNIETDSVMRQLGGVSLSVFSMLLSLIVPGSDSQPKYYKKLDKKHRLLLFLMKMKLGLPFCALGCIFRVHATTASTIFFENLESLVKATVKWIFWPSEAAIKDTLPLAFYNYPNCKAIIDCTEIKCDCPPTVEQRGSMYSNYKGCFTFKFLMAVSPNGFISFLSKAYGGRATDGFIVNDSGFLKLIEQGDIIMADKGFPQIKTEIMERKATLVIPPFCHNPQFTAEVRESDKVASVGMVERAIQRTKAYGILHHVNVELFPYMDKIMHMCCVLANHEPPLIKESQN